MVLRSVSPDGTQQARANRVPDPGGVTHPGLSLGSPASCRRDEAERVKRCGARVLTLDQLEGLKVSLAVTVAPSDSDVQ